MSICLVSFLSKAHEPINLNTQDVYLFGNLLSTDHPSGTLEELIGVTPGIGLGTPLSGIKLGYGQVFIEGGYNFLGTYHKTIREDYFGAGRSTNFLLFDREKTVHAAFFNFKVSFPLSNSFLMNLKLGRNLFYEEFKATNQTDEARLYEIEEKSKFSHSSYSSFGFEYLASKDVSFLIEGINYNRGIHSTNFSIIVRL